MILRRVIEHAEKQERTIAAPENEIKGVRE